jgi:hypothetical protein
MIVGADTALYQFLINSKETQTERKLVWVNGAQQVGLFVMTGVSAVVWHSN